MHGKFGWLDEDKHGVHFDCEPALAIEYSPHDGSLTPTATRVGPTLPVIDPGDMVTDPYGLVPVVLRVD
ncbi:hypothetical protein Sfulv_16380 [Streptomyces fulvorobeus]|uniref:Uncharacterized protein n=1 Tax=Streptomyces fulvorobeus TaxID=284028 RepID=A0A7J0C418_9ACTN|nr:hypothetical protein Sfulv_16380 [Streptomyces fulvorobeus]